MSANCFSLWFLRFLWIITTPTIAAIQAPPITTGMMISIGARLLELFPSVLGLTPNGVTEADGVTEGVCVIVGLAEGDDEQEGLGDWLGLEVPLGLEDALGEAGAE